MDTPFGLRMPLKHRNLPTDQTAPNEYTINVTLRHTVQQIQQSIWLFSDNAQLVPPSIELLYDQQPVRGSQTLGDLFGVRTPSELSPNHGLRLYIDHSKTQQFEFPTSTPAADLFDVEIIPDFSFPAGSGTTACFTRESLVSTVQSLKEVAAAKYKTDIERVELYYNNEHVSQNLLMRELLRLDVPPLELVQLGLKIRPAQRIVEVRPKDTVSSPSSVSVEGKMQFKIPVDENTTLLDFKRAIARATGHAMVRLELYTQAHCFSPALNVVEQAPLSRFVALQNNEFQSPPEVVYVVRDNLCLDIDGETWTASGQSYMEVANGSRTKLVKPTAVAEEIYEIEIDGKTVELSTAECIMTPYGSILINSIAMNKLTEICGLNEENSVEVSKLTTVEGDSTVSLTETRQPINRYIQSRSSSAVPNSMEQTSPQSTEGSYRYRTETGAIYVTQNDRGLRESQENTNNGVNGRMTEIETVHVNDTVVTPATVNNNFVQMINDDHGNNRHQQNSGIFQVLIQVANHNRGRVMQLVFRVGFSMLLMGGDVIFELLRPPILIILGLSLWLLLLLGFGEDISNWIDENVLAHSSSDQFGFAIIKFLSTSIRVVYNANASFTGMISRQCVNVVRGLHKSRYEALEEELFGNAIWVGVKKVVRQSSQAFFLGGITVFPFLESDLEDFFRRSHIQENRNLRKIIQRQMKTLNDTEIGESARALIESELSTSVDTLLEQESVESFSEALRCYLMASWMLKNKTIAGLPEFLRADMNRS